MTANRLAAFNYLTAEKADHYRRVMATFLHAKQSFVLHLRPDDVARGMDEAGEDHDGEHRDSTGDRDDTGDRGDRDEPRRVAGPRDSGEVTATELDAIRTLLAQLVEWGNLRADPDTADVVTVEDFYRARFLYQLTVEGEAAERAVAHFHELLVTPGELQTAALSDIRELLGELLVLARSGDPDPGKVHRSLTTLTTRFEELTDRARTFITGLQRTVDLHGIELDAFVAYKDRLIEYLERFVGDLVVAQGHVASLLADIDAAGSARLLAIAADRDLVDRLDPTDTDRARVHRRWRERWDGLASWFVAPGARPAQADILRARSRQAIPALLQAVSQINERRVSRTDRPADLRTLARWFAECPTDADAHRLWRAAFGLSPSRHLKVDGDTLDERAREPVPAATSWLDAPPLQVSPQLRRTGHYLRRGRPTSVIDRSADKARLAHQAHREAVQLAAARAQLVTSGVVRLSELGHLDPDGFGLFLDLLGEALAAPPGPRGAVRVTSADGGLEIALTPTDDGRFATIDTTHGALTGPDHHVEIVDLAGPVATERGTGSDDTDRPGHADLDGRDADGRDADGRDADGRDADGRQADGRDRGRPETDSPGGARREPGAADANRAPPQVVRS